jgi:hypothetical protein
VNRSSSTKRPTQIQLAKAIRRATINLKFSPVFMGRAIKNTAVQPLLDGVCSYLSNPVEKDVVAHECASGDTFTEGSSTHSMVRIAILAYFCSHGLVSLMIVCYIHAGIHVRPRPCHFALTQARWTRNTKLRLCAQPIPERGPSKNTH